MWHFNQRTYSIFLFPFNGYLFKYVIHSVRVLIDPAEYFKCSRGLMAPENFYLLNPKHLSLFVLWILWSRPYVKFSITLHKSRQSCVILKFLLIEIDNQFRNFINSINSKFFFLVTNLPLIILINLTIFL